MKSKWKKKKIIHTDRRRYYYELNKFQQQKVAKQDPNKEYNGYTRTSPDTKRISQHRSPT